MDFYISFHTMAKLDNILNDYKIKILRDFYDINKLSIDYQSYENKYLLRKINKPIIKNKEYNNNKCIAYIWKKNYGKIQCNHSKKIKNFCKRHINKQDYGTINIL